MTKANTIKQNRRILIVGEGRETEYNYIVGFRKYFEIELKAAAISITPKRGKGGNACAIVKSAINAARTFEPNYKRGDRVYLLLDTEGSGRESELPEALTLASRNNIHVVLSSPSIEYWLLCHFENVPRRYFSNCADVIDELNKKWTSVCKTVYDKSDKDLFDRLSPLLGLACDQALKKDLHTLKSQSVVFGVNPSSQIYELIAFLIGVRTGEKCPIACTWTAIGDDASKADFQKGILMPSCKNKRVTWQASW